MKKSVIITLSLLALATGWLLSFTLINPQPKITHVPKTESATIYPIDSQFVRVFDVVIEPNKRYRNIDFNFIYTSFIIEFIEDQQVDRALYRSKEKELTRFNGYGHSEDDEPRNLSGFVIPALPQKTMDFYSGSVSGKIRIFLFYAPPLNIPLGASLLKSKDSCSKPPMVSGAIWRDGLPDPIGTREPTEVRHNIVHHAASSNSNHNYLNVVRNIYLLHTQSNGWDDIGYNFVIAQDGSIFEGRDPQGVADSDNTKGAHFCGKNSNTMGICMLGNFMETSPTDTAIKSLKNLLSWKCVKSSLYPEGQNNHPTPSSKLLPVISGHRDGCATACPGDSLYSFLPAIRRLVTSHWLACGGVADVDPIASKNNWKVIVSDINIKIEDGSYPWERADLYSLSGMKLGSYTPNANISKPSPGIYYFVLNPISNHPVIIKFPVIE